jgi:hypothetical protein
MSVVSHQDVEQLEVVPGFDHENLQGRVFESISDDELRDALEKAFDYRGDVTVSLKDGSAVEGYIFDRRTGATLSDSVVRLFPKSEPVKKTIPYDQIAGLSFTGRDTAAGKTWEAWLKKYWEKKQAGETNIQLVPESLD